MGKKKSEAKRNAKDTVFCERFCRILDSCVKRLGRTREAVKEAIRICLEEKVLEQYLKERSFASFTSLYHIEMISTL